MVRFLLFLLSVFFLVEEFGCGKRCNEPDHYFVVSDSFSPEKDSIQVGDTLFFECTIPKLEEDIKTGMLINFSNLVNLGDNLVISDISKFSTHRNAADSFEFVSILGNIYTDQYNAHQLNFVETDSSYIVKIGFIALKKGIYIFTLPDAPGVYRKNHIKCGRGNFRILNSNMDKHLYLFTEIVGSLSNYDATHSYCVKVY